MYVRTARWPKFGVTLPWKKTFDMILLYPKKIIIAFELNVPEAKRINIFHPQSVKNSEIKFGDEAWS